MATTAIYNIGGIGIKVNFLCPFILSLNNCGSSCFMVNYKHPACWAINIDEAKQVNIAGLDVVFEGAREFEKDIPYKWQLLKDGSRKYIHFEFEDDNQIESGLAMIDEKSRIINLNLLKKKDTISIDPFFHPVGILLLQYIIHISKGFIMHASAVDCNGMGFLFTAVSGTGKSTMANLWKQKGATIINDDRIIVQPSAEGHKLYNTPMPYYKDANKSVRLKQLFIIKQSPENYIKPLNSTQGTLTILGNCIQYQFDEYQIKERLDYIEQAVQKHGVYELGFRPDVSIVDLILEQFG